MRAPRVLAKLKTLKELADVNTDQQNQGLEASLQIDRATAARLNITPKLIDDALYDAFGQRQVSTTWYWLAACTSSTPGRWPKAS